MLKAIAIAASLLGIAAAGFLMPSPRSSYSTGVGEHRSVRLDDGSTIDLNSRSQVRIRDGGHRRDVELIEGQALFRVAKDESRPLMVSAASTQVRAVGDAHFDVYRSKAGTVVTALEGRVAVTEEGAAETLLVAGEQLSVTPVRITPPQRADVEVVTAWTRRELAFKGTPLSDVAKEFNRYNERPLVVEDAALADMHVSGVFSSTDPDSLLQFLRSLPGIEVQEEPGVIRITREPVLKNAVLPAVPASPRDPPD